MRTPALQQLLPLAFLALLMAPLASRAEDFAILLHPATQLTPEQDPFPQNRRQFRDAFRGYARADPVIRGATSAKEAPDTRCFILQLEKPRTASYSGTEEGVPEDGGQSRDFPFKGVHVVLPFSLWYRSAPSADPVLLGRAFTWSDASQIEYLRSDGPNRKFKIHDFSIEEMTCMAIEEELPELASRLADAWSPKVIHQPPRLNVTPERAVELLRQSLSTTVASSSLVVLTTYSPSRVVKDPDGRVVVEIDLFNRLPVRAHGQLTCRPARIPYPDGFATPEQIQNIRQKNEARRYLVTCTFDLAPGQKDVARFVIPREAGADPQLFGNDQITLDGGASALGEADKDNPKRKGSRRVRSTSRPATEK